MHQPTGNDSVALQAFLYATGELDEAEAAAFERRLGEDQAAREALCQAVELTQALAPRPAPRPDPSYRQRVRERLRHRRLGWLFGRQTYRGHPAVWSAVGAAAAVLIVISIAHLQAALVTQRHRPLPVPRGVEQEAPIPAPFVEPPQLTATEDMAVTWATLHTNSVNHVTKVHDEEMRRKHRLEERTRLALPAERRPRPMSNQSPQ